MKTLLIVLLYSTSVYSTYENQVETCIEQGQYYGQVQGDKIAPHCYNLFKDLSSPQNNVKSEEKNIYFFGHKNILFIEDHESEEVFKISGPQSKLYEIKNILYDSKNHRLVVLNKGEDLLLSVQTYLIRKGGNVAPVRSFTLAPEIENPEISLDLERDKILVKDMDAQRLYEYKIEACVLGRRAENSIEPEVSTID